MAKKECQGLVRKALKEFINKIIQGIVFPMPTKELLKGKLFYNIQRPETNGQPVIKIKTNNKKGYEIAVEGDTINYQNLKSTTRRGRVGKQIAQTLDSGGEQAVIGYSRDAKGKVTNYHTKDIANTLHSSSGGGGNTDQYILNKSIRRLTPIECERLQGFPDNWTRHGQELGEISDSQRYKMCGNAVTVDVVEAVAKKIKESL